MSTSFGSTADRLRVLMLLCQKICATGSGVVVKETIDRAALAGVDFAVLSGGYAADDPSQLLRNRPEHMEQVVFEAAPPEGVPTPIVGMSNRMPYRSKAFKDLTSAETDAYVAVWARHVQRLIHAFRPDLIHVHHLWLLAAVAAQVDARLPIVVSIHGTDLQRADDAPAVKRRVEPFVRRFARFLALTQEAVALTRARYDVDPQRFVVLGNGFNEQLFRPDRHGSPDVLRRYGIDPGDGRPIVLFVGKLERWKGIEWLIRAFTAVRRRGTLDPRLVIAGGGPGEERTRYADLARTCGVADDVVFSGVVPYEDVGLLMNAAPLLVLPAVQEPFGLVVLEALASGCRVISTDQGGPPSFIPSELRERQDALLVAGLPSADPEPGDALRFVGDLADAMARQLTRPRRPREREEIASTVRHLTWNEYASRLGEAYREVTGR